MNVEKLIKRVADESTPELFSEILKKAGAEGLVPESKAEKYTPSKKPGVNKGVVISVVTAVTVAAAGMGIGIPLALNSNGAPATPSGSDSGFVTPENPTPETPTPENPAPETPVTPTPENPTPETPVTPHEHVYGEWKLVTEKSCAADGLKERECECGDKEQEAIPMGHEYQYDNDINHHWQVCTACETRTQKESHDFAGAYETCTVCDYCEELYILDDEKDMYFQLVNDEYYGFTGISKQLDKLTELRIPDFWKDPLRPELGWLPVAYVGGSILEGESLIRRIRLPVGLIHIENWAFSGMTNLREVEMCDGVEYIGKEAFAHCENLKYIYLPDTITDIAPDAFDFSGIETLLIPTMDYYNYGDKCFIDLHYYNMPSLKNIEIYWNPHYKFEDGLLTYCNSLDDIGDTIIETRLITFLDGADVSTGYNSICDNAFRNKQLADTDLYLPSDLVYIGFNAFNNCNIKSIHIGADVRLIMNDAFTYAPDLTDIYFSGTIERWKFIEYDAANKKGLVIHCSDGDIVC